MGTIFIREMTGGLDARRLPESTPGGVLIRANDGHITRGGEFEVRAGFIKEFTLPATTHGLAHTRTGLMTFGSGAAPALPRGVRYQQLVHGSETLVNIIDWELFEDKLYVVAEFSDGSVVHFYDGVKVAAWQEARARAVIRIETGAVVPAVRATASFEVISGTPEIINWIDEISVSGTQILPYRIVFTDDRDATAALIAQAINDFPTAPKYTATAAGGVVTVTADRAGAQANGRTFSFVTRGNFTVGNATDFSGGADEIVPRIDDVKIDGVSIIRRAVPWTNAQEVAGALADAISETASTPEYEASVEGVDVYVRAASEGTAANGRAIVIEATGNITWSFPKGDTLAGGTALDPNKYIPADTVLTVKEKLYAGGASILHYSGVGDPTMWDPSGTPAGAGFTNIAASNSSSYRITGQARYYDKLAVFTPDTVQLWYIDPDPDLFVQTQVLENTGTDCTHSITQFGDSDIFYLDVSGLRSMRARDSSNAAATTDIGVPIDDLLTARLRDMTLSDKRRVTGLINPMDKRFWLIMGGEAFIYSYYPNSKVNAWTRYSLSETNDSVRTNFVVDTAITFDNRVFLRATNGDVYCYGGWGQSVQHDDTRGEAWLPMLDAGSPAAKKDWTGVDAAVSGNWEIYVAYDPLRPDDMSHVANIADTTYAKRRMPMKHKSTHAGLRFISRGGPAVLSAVVLHFDGKVSED